MDGELGQFADAYWDKVLASKPLLATQVGDERFDDQLPDLSEAGRASAATLHRQALNELENFNPSTLGLDERTTLGMVGSLARAELDALKHRFDLLEVLSHMWGPGTLLATLGSLQRADTAELLDRYLTRLNAFPKYLDAAIELVHEAAAAGQLPPRVVVERTIAQVTRLLDAGTERNPALNAVAEDDHAGRKRVAATLATVVLPAFQRYLEAARAVRESSPEELGLCALRRGPEMYASKVLTWTSAPMDPQEVHAFGQAEVEKINEERAKIAHRLGHASAEAAIAAAKERGEITSESRQEILALAEEQVERSWEFCHDYFGHLPKENCQVKPIDPSRETDVLDHYLPPTADGSRPGIYYVHTAPGRSVHSLASTTYHEGNPGHHLQMSLEQEAAARPAIRRFGSELVASAFVEGWGLYSERLADEMGLYVSDYERIGMLEQQVLRAVRLVVDTGIHAHGWTRDRALQEMVQTGMAAGEIQIEVDRYAALPAQALTYKVGQRAIEQLREQAVAREGGSFSLKGFHDRLMTLGSLPLEALEAEMERDD